MKQERRAASCPPVLSAIPGAAPFRSGCGLPNLIMPMPRRPGTLYQGDLVADLGTADVLLNAGVFGETSQVMAGARGGFVWMPGRLSMQRQTTGASAIVRMPELMGVPL